MVYFSYMLTMETRNLSILGLQAVKISGWHIYEATQTIRLDIFQVSPKRPLEGV